MSISCLRVRWLLPVVAALAASCAAPATSRPGVEAPVVYYVGTRDYDRRAADFAITLTQAEAKLAEYLRENVPGLGPDQKRLGTGRHRLIVGRAYHFFMPLKSGGIPLTGYYVDGFTGQVEFRSVRGSVPYVH
jgi:hypothetical protein